jgi:hypothetical protein
LVDKQELAKVEGSDQHEGEGGKDKSSFDEDAAALSLPGLAGVHGAVS